MLSHLKTWGKYIKKKSMPEADINVCNIYVCGSVIIPRGTGGTEYKGGGCEHTTNEKDFSLIKVHTLGD